MVLRNQTVDLLKGIAVVLMIQVHIVELFANEKISESISGSFLMFLGGPPVAPIFVSILGYFIAKSTKNTKQLIIRGLKIFSLGMLLNISLNFNLIYSVYKGAIVIDIFPYIFGVDILQFAGISIIILAVLKKVVNSNLVALLAFLIISIIMSNLLLPFHIENELLRYILSFFYGCSKWAYFPLFPWISYPLVGMFFYHLQNAFKFKEIDTLKYKIGLISVFIVFMTFTFKYAIGISVDLLNYYHHDFLFSIWLIVFILLYFLIINLIKSKNIGIKYLKWIGKEVTVIYVIQWILIGNIATEIYKTITEPIYLLVYFIFILMISSLFAWFVFKIKEKYFKSL